MENLSSRPTTSAPGFAHGPAHTQAGTLHASANANAAAPPPYYVSPPQLPTPPPGVPQGTLAIFNQTCSKLGFNVGWESNSHGPQHDPRWEVKCLGERCRFRSGISVLMWIFAVNGVQRGIGVGRNQKMSKELAAREAWQYMTSVNWTCEFFASYLSSTSLTVIQCNSQKPKLRRACITGTRVLDSPL